MSEHTATPWFGFKDGVHPDSNWYACNDDADTTCSASIVDANGDSVALVVAAQWDESEMEANSKFIVRACNAHDDLVKALRDVLSNSNRGTSGRLIIDILQEQYLENLLAKVEPA